MTFTPGDVVILKSGGHSMTVVAVGEEEIDCLWTGDGGALFRQSIPAIALDIVESEAEDTDEAEADEDEDQDDDEDDDEDEDEDDDDDEKREKKRKKG